MNIRGDSMKKVHILRRRVATLLSLLRMIGAILDGFQSWPLLAGWLWVENEREGWGTIFSYDGINTIISGD